MKWLGIQTTANAGSVKPQGMNSTPGEHSPFPSTTPAGGRPISEPLSQADLPIRIGKASRRGRGGVFDLAMGVGRDKCLDPKLFFWGGRIRCLLTRTAHAATLFPLFSALSASAPLRESSPSGLGEPPAEDAVAFSTWPWEWVGANALIQSLFKGGDPLPAHQGRSRDHLTPADKPRLPYLRVFPAFLLLWYTRPSRLVRIWHQRPTRTGQGLP